MEEKRVCFLAPIAKKLPSINPDDEVLGWHVHKKKTLSYWVVARLSPRCLTGIPGEQQPLRQPIGGNSCIQSDASGSQEMVSCDKRPASEGGGKITGLSPHLPDLCFLARKSPIISPKKTKRN